MLVAPSVLDMLESRVSAHPDKLAYSFVGADGQETASHSYASFLARVQAISSALVTRTELAPGDRVILVFPPGLDMMAALFGCARAGLISVPVAPITSHTRRAAVARIARVAQDCTAAAVLCAQSCLALFQAEDPDRDGTDEAFAAAATLPWIVADEISDDDQPERRRPPNRLFMLQYTSGSTSQPKGVMVTHENILANRSALVDHEDPVCVTWLPQHHDMGLIGSYTYSVLSGGSTHGFAPSTFIQRPGLWLQLMSTHRATASSAPNFAFEYCLDPRRVPDRMLDGLDLRSIRYLSMAAEPVRALTYQRFLARFERTGLDAKRLVVGYGLAENTLVVSHYGRGAMSVDKRALAEGKVRPVQKSFQIGAATRLMNCGRPVGETEIKIVDPETCIPSQGGQVGEIWVRGPSKCAGYWGKSKLSRQVFEAKSADGETGYLRTGDTGFLQDGDLFVCGRRNDLIIVRGQNFYPQDIETAAEEAFSEIGAGGTAAVPVPTPDGGQSLVLVIERRRKAEPIDGRAILGAVCGRVGVDVDRVVFVPPRSLPKTTSGKIQRFEVALLLQSGGFTILAEHCNRDHECADVAHDPAQQSLLDELLARYRLTGDEDLTLLEAGFNSLDLVALLHAVQDRISDQGKGNLAADVDMGVVQNLRIRDMVQMLRKLGPDGHAESAQMAPLLKLLRQDRLKREQALMRADLELAASLPALPATPPAKDGSIFLTGATGFLGPYLLQNLLTQTDRPIIALVRAATDAAARARLFDHLRASGLDRLLDANNERVQVVAGDLCQPRFGLDAARWSALAEDVASIFHNGAVVNYLQSYQQMRQANVLGTLEALRLAREARPKVFNHISTTFVFGWRHLDRVREDDANEGMEGLDFGYSQSKWVAEGLVRRAADGGLPVRTFRPSLLTPSLAGTGFGLDITLRLLAFMVKHGIGVGSENEISLVPVDIAARNICAIAASGDTVGGTFHVTRDDHSRMKDIMAALSRVTGRQFEMFAVQDFVPEAIARCTREDPLYPLVDFLIQSVDWMTAMEFKRYDSQAYQSARDAAPAALPDPGLDEVVAGVLTYLKRNRLI